MNADIQDLDGKIIGSVNLPRIFLTSFRPDLIHRVFLAIATHNLQPQGRDTLAGQKTSAESWGTGRGASRVARVKGGGRRGGQAAGVAMVVGGRTTHPPRSEKKIRKEVNRKERRLALASAIAATTEKQIVSLRGHKIPEERNLPIIVNDDVQKINKTSDLLDFFLSINLGDDIERVNHSRKTRSGVSRRRGRTIKTGKGPLIVVSEDKGIGKAANNIPGIDCVLAKNLTVTDLAPGSQAGRLVVWSKSAINNLPKPLLEVGNLIAT